MSLVVAVVFKSRPPPRVQWTCGFCLSGCVAVLGVLLLLACAG